MKQVLGVSRVTIKKSKNVRLCVYVHVFTGVVPEVQFDCAISPSISSTVLQLQIMFVVAKPDVFKSPDSDTYIIFGEAKVEDFGAQAQAQAAQNFAPPSQSAAQAVQPTSTSAAAVTDTAAEPMEDVDSTGIAENDIDLVMNQAGVSRAKAVAALRKQDSDIVSAIMELTMA